MSITDCKCHGIQEISVGFACFILGESYQMHLFQRFLIFHAFLFQRTAKVRSSAVYYLMSFVKKSSTQLGFYIHSWCRVITRHLYLLKICSGCFMCLSLSLFVLCICFILCNLFLDIRYQNTYPVITLFNPFHATDLF